MRAAAQSARGRSAQQETDGQITGRVTDPSGHPVGSVFVSVLEEYERDPRGGPPVHPVNVRLFALTEADGSYTLKGLRTGRYLVVAIPHQTNRSTPTGFGITYFPGTARQAEARSVFVPRSGTTSANIVLAPARLFNIAGSAHLSNGEPARAMPLYLAHGDGLFGLDSGRGTTRADGTFGIAGFPPGTYFLQIREGTWPPPRDVIPRISGARVTIVDRDVTDARVAPISMVRATGRVIVDAETRRSLNPSSIRVSATPFDWDGNPGPQRAGTLTSDLHFEFRTWPGRGTVRVLPESAWVVTAIRLGGVDVTRSGIDFRAGSEISGLEVEIVKR